MSNSNNQTNERCGLISESSGLPIMSVVQKRKGNPSSYGQIRYLMKRLTTALDKRLRDGRPSKYCRLCKAEIRSLFREEKDKQLKLKEYRTEKNQNIRRRTKKDSGSQRSLRRDHRREAKEDKYRQTGNKLELKTTK